MIIPILCFTLATSIPLSHKKAPSVRPESREIVSDQWRVIDGGKRWRQTVIYKDGSRKCFIIEIPQMK